MTEYLEGGRRRIDRVLGRDFASDIEDMDDDELVRRRGDAEQEEVDLSYARRLLQGRLDLLRAEADRRSSGTPDPPRTDVQLVEQLSRILAEDLPSSDRLADAHFVSAEPSRVGEHRRAVEAVIADVELSDVRHLDDRLLREATERLTQMEHDLSRTRAAVHQVQDRLDGALADRLGRGARR
jgi:hypothetical protein